MKKRNKIIIAAALFVGLCAISFSTTYAYLISQDEAVNTFTVGENEIEVVEDYTPPEKLKPDVEFKKDVSAKNTGNLPCFVRMRVDFSDSRAEEFCEPLNIDTSNWEYKSEDGYYYYRKFLRLEKQPHRCSQK